MSATPATEIKPNTITTPTGTDPRRSSVAPYVVLALAALFFITGSDAWMSIANYTLIYAIAALGLNVLSGYAGQVSLGITFFNVSSG